MAGNGFHISRRAELVGLISAGKTAAEISAHFAVSRNTVIGVIHRDETLPRLRTGSRTNSAHPHVQASPQLPTTVSLPGDQQVKARTVANRRGHEDQSIASRVRAHAAFNRGDCAPPTVAGYKPERWCEGFQGQTAGVRKLEKLQPQHCRFPIDLENGRVGYCGEQKEEDTSYCTAHAARCFSPESAAMRRRLK
jgi:hypothetical protein